jgi:hypothetical protein
VLLLLLLRCLLLLAGLMRGAVSVALVYYYFDDNPRQVLDRGRATLIVSTLMVRRAAEMWGLAVQVSDIQCSCIPCHVALLIRKHSEHLCWWCWCCSRCWCWAWNLQAWCAAGCHA